MRKTMMALALAGSATLGLSACSHGTSRDTLRGAGFGAAGGAIAGAVVPGLGVGEGAAIGAAGGAVIGAVTSDGNRNYRRDRRGRDYYVNDRGRRVYRR